LFSAARNESPTVSACARAGNVAGAANIAAATITPADTASERIAVAGRVPPVILLGLLVAEIFTSATLLYYSHIYNTVR
jgi:hypothetical protein